MKVYMDSSVVLRWVLRQPGALENWLDWEFVLTSELLDVEVRRSFDRLRVQGKLDDQQVAEHLSAANSLISSFERAPVSRMVLRRAASPFPTALGTLDAIHLATALLWIEEQGEPLTLLTHDAELALAARASGLEVKTTP
jgi:predicted nucleic acid-binding protein